MPEQFPYPEEGWSTGKMRMAKAGPRGTGVSVDEYKELMGQQRKRKEAQASELTPEQWQKWRENFPQGQLIGKDHPELSSLQDTHDIFTIPDKNYEKYLFLNPKPNGWQGPGPERA